MKNVYEHFVPDNIGHAYELIMEMCEVMEPDQKVWLSTKNEEPVLLTRDEAGTRYLHVWQDQLKDYQLEVGSYSGSVLRLTKGSLAAAGSQEEVDQYWSDFLECWAWFFRGQ